MSNTLFLNLSRHFICGKPSFRSSFVTSTHQYTHKRFPPSPSLQSGKHIVDELPTGTSSIKPVLGYSAHARHTAINGPDICFRSDMPKRRQFDATSLVSTTIPMSNHQLCSFNTCCSTVSSGKNVKSMFTRNVFQE